METIREDFGRRDSYWLNIELSQINNRYITPEI